MALDSSARLVVVGYSESSNFPTTAGAYDASYNGGGDAFVAKLAPGSQVGVSESVPDVSSILRIAPNPSTGPVTFDFRIEQASSLVSLRIYDVTGRLVAVQSLLGLAPGLHHVTWDGTGVGGKPAAPGTYFGVLATDHGQKGVAKVVIIR